MVCREARLVLASSQRCNRGMTARLPPEQKKIGFWLHVEKDGPKGCWLWTGRRSNGYGRCSFRGRSMMAHRASWIMARGPIPAGLLVLHDCDVPNCVNPDHLFLGTYKTNMDDMYAKGRGPVGDRNGSRTRPDRRATGDRNGSRTHPEARPRGDQHWTRQHPERLRGMRNPNTRLTDEDVAMIRRLYDEGYSQTELAQRYKVSQAHISRLVLRRERA